MIRDVAVKVPEPEDFIAESVFPSHIIVPRCSGQASLSQLYFVVKIKIFLLGWRYESNKCYSTGNFLENLTDKKEYIAVQISFS